MTFEVCSNLKQRILYIILPIVLFTSCNNTTEELEMPNPVIGVWNNYYHQTDSLVMTRIFTADFYSYFTFAEGKIQNEMNKQHYSIDKSSIMLDQYTQGYEILADTLWITNSKRDQTTKYIRAD